MLGAPLFWDNYAGVAGAPSVWDGVGLGDTVRHRMGDMCPTWMGMV